MRNAMHTQARIGNDHPEGKPAVRIVVLLLDVTTPVSIQANLHVSTVHPSRMSDRMAAGRDLPDTGSLFFMIFCRLARVFAE
jgi:hypothetical protein